MPPALIPEIQVQKKPDNNGDDTHGDGERDVVADEDYDPLSKEMESSDEDSDDDHGCDDLI